MTGKNNPAWRGGTTKIIFRVRSCQKYRDWRKQIFERDNYSCTICGDSIGGNLNAHHKNPLYNILKQYNIKSFGEALGCNDIWNIDNGETLCEKCHKLTDTFGTKAFAKALS